MASQFLDASGAEVSIDEIVKLCAVDSLLFPQVFFPQTVRQDSPPAHRKIWEHLDDPSARYLNLLAARGWAKTTMLRLFVAKRIAYDLSRTILYVGASEGHAARSVTWLRGQIERNKLFAETFDLRLRKRSETELQIMHGVSQRPIWILGVGITGNVRGINFDDYRPDLIILDDILTDENAATHEQRDKITSLVFGALKESLVPATEEPNAKLVHLFTPQNAEDVGTIALKDPQWRSEVFACWTPETLHLPVEEQESSWPERYPTETLRAEKKSAISRNQASIFAREMECRIIAPEAAAFRRDWLQFFTNETRPRGAYCVIAVDPVPPPSDLQVAKGLQGKNYEAIAVCGRYAGKYYVLDYEQRKGHDPGWTIAKIFELALKYRASQIVIETIGYQRVLKYILEQEMARRQQYWAIIPFVDKRKKFNRIVSTLSGIASAHLLYCDSLHTEFIAQFSDYPNVPYDDLLDSVAIGMSQITKPYLELGEGEYWELDDGNIPPIQRTKSRLAP